MTMIKTAIAAAALAFALSTGAMAQTATDTTKSTTATTKTVKAPKVKAPAKPRSEASMACSKDADAKNLHGKARKTFRETCMKGKH
jgi:hypothetical protein